MRWEEEKGKGLGMGCSPGAGRGREPALLPLGPCFGAPHRGVPSAGSQRSLAGKGKQLIHALHNREKRRPSEPGGCRPTLGIKVEQRIPGGEHGLGGGETGSSEQQRGQPGHGPEGHGWESSSPFPGGKAAECRGQNPGTSHPIGAEMGWRLL